MIRNVDLSPVEIHASSWARVVRLDLAMLGHADEVLCGRTAGSRESARWPAATSWRPDGDRDSRRAVERPPQDGHDEHSTRDHCEVRDGTQDAEAHDQRRGARWGMCGAQHVQQERGHRDCKRCCTDPSRREP